MYLSLFRHFHDCWRVQVLLFFCGLESSQRSSGDGTHGGHPVRVPPRPSACSSWSKCWPVTSGEMEHRMAATMATMAATYACVVVPLRMPMVLFAGKCSFTNSMIKWLETVELTNALLSKLEAVQLRGLRKILHTAPHLDTRNSNAEIYRRANAAVAAGRWSAARSLHDKRIALTRHILRADDPMRQVTFRREDPCFSISAVGFFRPGRPRKHWTDTSLDRWTKTHNTPFIHAANQQTSYLSKLEADWSSLYGSRRLLITRYVLGFLTIGA